MTAFIALVLFVTSALSPIINENALPLMPINTFKVQNRRALFINAEHFALCSIQTTPRESKVASINTVSWYSDMFICFQ